MCIYDYLINVSILCDVLIGVTLEIQFLAALNFDIFEGYENMYLRDNTPTVVSEKLIGVTPKSDLGWSETYLRAEMRLKVDHVYSSTNVPHGSRIKLMSWLPVV